MGNQLIPTGIATGVGSSFRTQVTQAIAPGVRFVMPVGLFIVYVVGADVRMQVQDAAGVWNNITAAGAIPSGDIFSDGTNRAFINNGVGSESITYIQIG